MQKITAASNALIICLGLAACQPEAGNAQAQQRNFVCKALIEGFLSAQQLNRYELHQIQPAQQGAEVGAILTGVFAAPVLGGFGTVEDIGAQVWIQIVGVLVTVVYTGIVTFVILKVLDLVMGLRVSEESETVGLDLSEHNERGYNL